MNKRSTHIIPCMNARLYSGVLPALLAGALLVVAGCGTPDVELDPDVAVDTSAGVDSSQGDVPVQTDAAGADATGDQCITDYDCKDAKGKTPCSLPRCNNGYCGWDFKATGSPCDDEDNLGKDSACEKARCDDKGTCAMQAEPEGAACVPEGGLTECERAGCNLAMECTVTIKPDETKCGDGECGEWCEKGVCTNVPDTHYEDGDPCTKDYCEQNSKIMHDPITSVAPCDDGNPCTGDGTCKAGKCEAQGGEDCDDGLACTKDTCGKSGCEHTADDKACTDDGGCFNIGCDLAVGCTATTVISGGACSDGDSCTTDDICDDKGACVAKTNKCKCKTDAECDQTDLCLPRYCDVQVEECVVAADKKVVCDKHTSPSCGKNVCDPKTGQCEVIAENTGAACDDGDKCTTKTACKDGNCTGEADLKCDDNNPCTADSCSNGCKFTEAPGDCDDGVACTVNDTCVAGGCVGTKKPCDDGIACTFDACDPKTGACTNVPKANKPCDDNNPCTADSCDTKSGCKNVPDDKAACEDDDKCTVTACKSGKCVTTKIDKTVAGCGCTEHKQCDDNNPCTADTCDKGDCVFAAAAQDNKPCQGGNPCQLNMKCSKGSCTGGSPKVCSDGNPCTNDACSAKTGKCGTSPKGDGTKCDADGSLCTQDDTCKNGACSAGPLKSCDGQGDACNLASCEAKTGKCVKTPVKAGGACDDGKFCTDNDKCDGAGTCKPGPVKSCSSAADQCNTGSCDEAKKTCAKKPKAATTSCDDGQYCTTADKCDGKGACIGGKARVCQDNLNDCKAGFCDDKGDKCALKSAPAGTSCSDGNLCTQTDKCDSSGACKGSNVKTCAGDQCNSGVCDVKTGACGKKALSNGTKCNDANLCTLTDTCQSGACKGANPKKCTGDQCNDGVCAPKTGACGKQPKAKGTACSDGNSCTAKDTCASGVCNPGVYSCVCKVASQAKDCDDENSCTKDLCTLSGGKYTCTNPAATGQSCSDGNLCTTSDKCTSSKTCVGTAITCNDNNKCTVDACDKSTGKCTYKILSGFPCSDDKLCTTNDVCNSKGGCVGKTVYCNDGNGCTTDSCNSKTGECQYLNNTASCNDGNACTLGDKCSSGKCKAGATKNCADSTKCSTDGCNTKTGACTHTPAYENYSCEGGSYSICASGSCKCRVWSTLNGGTSTDRIYGIAKTSDLGTVSVGISYVSGKSYEGYLIRHDKTGKVLWAKTVPGSTSTDYLKAVTATNVKDQFLAVGYRYLNSTYNYVGWVVRFTAAGSILSNTTVNLTKSNDYLLSVIHDGTGNYYAAGYTYGINAGYSSGWVVKLNSSGSATQHMYKAGIKVVKSSVTRYHYYFYGIARYSTYLFAVGSTTESKYGGNDGAVVRFTTSGKSSGQWWYGAAGYDTIYAVKSYGSYMFLGGRIQNKTTTANGYDAWLMRIHYGGTKYQDLKYGSTGTDSFYALDNWGSGVFAVGTYYDPKLKRSRGYAVRSSYSGSTYGQYYYGHTSYNTNLYAVEDDGNSSYYTLGGETSQGIQAYAVQTTYHGVYSCGKSTYPGGGGSSK